MLLVTVLLGQCELNSYQEMTALNEDCIKPCIEVLVRETRLQWFISD